MALNNIMEIGATVEQGKLINELHLAAQELYYKGHIRFMTSCLKEILITAFNRFTELGACQAYVYYSQTGQKTIYLKCR
jgi:hypothetical protein